MLTRRAVGILLTAILLFFLAGTTSVGWVRIVDAVLWGMLLLSLPLQWLAVTAMSARRRVLSVQHSGEWTGPMEGDTVEVGLDLENRRFWPRFFVSVSYDAPLESPTSRSQRFFVANVNGHGTVNLSGMVSCCRRGLHHFGPVTIESQVPFGLFRRRKGATAPLSLLVYPKAFPLKRLALLEGSPGESERARRARTGQVVIGSRPYVPGDPVRHIHWRNTARLGKLAVKELEDTAQRAFTVVLHINQDIGEDRETPLEYGVKLAATVGLYALKSGESVRLVSGQTQGEWADPEPFLRELALLGPTESPPLTSLLDRMSANGPALAIVAAADLEETYALAQSSGRPEGLSAVVVGGFGDFDDPVGPTEMLRRSGVPAVSCQRGHLPEAIDALEHLGASADPVPTLRSVE